MFYKFLICFLFLQISDALDSNDCGQLKNKDNYNYPWLVGLSKSGGSYPFCGGSRISQNFILTSAKCVYRYKSPYDTLEISSFDGNEKYDTEMVQDIIIHPEFNHRSLNNDIALVKLKKNSKSSNSVPCLPCYNELDQNQNVGDNVTVSGFKILTNDGHSLNLDMDSWPARILSNDDCAEFHGSRFNSNQMFCLEKLQVQDQNDNCPDPQKIYFGSPALTQINGHWTQLGIFSWGYNCNSNKIVFTRVQEFMSWIEENSDYEYCRQKL